MTTQFGPQKLTAKAGGYPPPPPAPPAGLNTPSTEGSGQGRALVNQGLAAIVAELLRSDTVLSIARFLGFRTPEIDPQIWIGVGSVSGLYMAARQERFTTPGMGAGGNAEGFWTYIQNRMGGEPTFQRQCYQSSRWQWENWPELKANARDYWANRIGGSPTEVLAAWFKTSSATDARAALAYAENEAAKDRHKRPLDIHLLITASWWTCPTSISDIPRVLGIIERAKNDLALAGIDVNRLSVSEVNQVFGTGAQLLAVVGTGVAAATNLQKDETFTEWALRLTEAQVQSLHEPIRTKVKEIRAQYGAGSSLFAGLGGNSFLNSPVGIGLLVVAVVLGVWFFFLRKS